MPESYKPVTGLFNPPAWMTNAPKPDFMGGVQAGQRNQINKINLDQARREQDYIEQLSQSMQAGQGGQMPDFENMLQTGMEVALRTDPRKVMELARAQFNLQRQKEYDSYRNQPEIRNAPDGSLIRLDPTTGKILDTIMQKPPKEPKVKEPPKEKIYFKEDGSYKAFPSEAEAAQERYVLTSAPEDGVGRKIIKHPTEGSGSNPQARAAELIQQGFKKEEVKQKLREEFG